MMCNLYPTIGPDSALASSPKESPESTEFQIITKSLLVSCKVRNIQNKKTTVLNDNKNQGG